MRQSSGVFRGERALARATSQLYVSCETFVCSLQARAVHSAVAEHCQSSAMVASIDLSDAAARAKGTL